MALGGALPMLSPAREMLGSGGGLCPLDPGSPRKAEHKSWEQGAGWKLGRRKPGRTAEKGWWGAASRSSRR